MKKIAICIVSGLLFAGYGQVSANTWKYRFSGDVHPSLGSLTGEFSWNEHDQRYESFSFDSGVWSTNGGHLDSSNSTMSGSVDSYELMELGTDSLPFDGMIVNFQEPLDKLFNPGEFIKIIVSTSNVFDRLLDPHEVLGLTGRATLVEFQEWAPVPVPAAFPLMASALAGLGFFNHKRKTGKTIPA